MKFFPKELWPVLDRKAAKANGVLPATVHRRLKPPRKRNLDGVAGVNKDMAAESDDAERSVHEVSNDEDDPTDDLDVDDEFEDDDGDGGDYNAEAYFDDGGDDAGDDYDDGDGDGGDYF